VAAELRQLVDPATAERIVLALAALMVVVGLGAGAILGLWRRPFGPNFLGGAAVALLGPVVWLLWRVYNAVENAFGLDSVRALTVNLIVFVIAGFAIGAAGARLRRRLTSMRKEVGNG